MNFYENCLLTLKICIYSIFFYMFRIFPIKKNKIVFSSYQGKGFGDNGKYITLEILNEKKDYDIVWLVRDIHAGSFPKEVRKVKYRSLQAIYELVTAQVWIDNCRKPAYVRKRKSQFYINTGHGGIPLKKIEADAQDSIGVAYIKAAKNDSKMADLYISHAKFRTDILKNKYWYDGEVFECGSPKIERLLLNNAETIKKVKVKLDIPEETNIVLYAPTFRNSKDLGIYNINFELLRETIKESFGGEWAILFRLHPNMYEFSQKCSLPVNVKNVTAYEDMQELLISADILITDYSGTMFEKIYDQKKVLLYIPDYEVYERGYYFKFEEMPFPYAKTQEELIDNIKNWNHDQYLQDIKEFSKKIGLLYEFGASKKIVNRIAEVIESK